MQISLVSQFANSVFLINGEGWKNGTPFMFIMVTSILGLVLYQTRKKRYKYQNHKGEKKCKE